MDKRLTYCALFLFVCSCSCSFFVFNNPTNFHNLINTSIGIFLAFSYTSNNTLSHYIFFKARKKGKQNQKKQNKTKNRKRKKIINQLFTMFKIISELPFFSIFPEFVKFHHLACRFDCYCIYLLRLLFE